MTLPDVLNLAGLFLITIGSVFAALSAPVPQYNSDGSVSVSGEPDKSKRIAIYNRQKRLPLFLSLIGIGALVQASALFCM
ncbi:hypothetical protein L5L78_08560 [Shewanella sp. SM34]|uniref:hypothetical protein n=1 Tax=unclassified Shewanella TaxID=196818 RepID=UPI0021D87E91|nr:MULTISPECIES: hypothetical protein [unclassified Shewanella]MCU8056252.1 hypothetical protein [Shewanella sp. SM35]MCU8065186.1 hypothetical protein [Shewanella sp. SM34]